MNFNIGEIVIICKHPMRSGSIAWEYGMDEYCGASGEIISCDWSDGIPIYAVRAKSKYGIEKTWWFQEDWLEEDRGYYWSSSVDKKEYQQRGLDELRRQEASLKEKQDAIFRKIFRDE